MPFRSIVAEPEVVERLSGALAQAWAAIEARGALDPLRESAQRERLAHIIIGLWKSDPDGEFVEPAVEQFFGGVDPMDALAAISTQFAVAPKLDGPNTR